MEEWEESSLDFLVNSSSTDKLALIVLVQTEHFDLCSSEYSYMTLLFTNGRIIIIYMSQCYWRMGPSYSIYITVWLTDGPIEQYIYESVIDEWAHPVIYILQCNWRMGPSHSIYIRVWLTDGPIPQYIYYSVIDGWAHPTVYIWVCDWQMGPSCHIYITVWLTDGPIPQYIY